MNATKPTSESLTDEDREHREALEDMLSTTARYWSVYHDSDRCWRLIEFMLAEIRTQRAAAIRDIGQRRRLRAGYTRLSRDNARMREKLALVPLKNRETASLIADNARMHKALRGIACGEYNRDGCIHLAEIVLAEFFGEATP